MPIQNHGYTARVHGLTIQGHCFTAGVPGFPARILSSTACVPAFCTRTLSFTSRVPIPLLEPAFRYPSPQFHRQSHCAARFHGPSLTQRRACVSGRSASDSKIESRTLNRTCLSKHWYDSFFIPFISVSESFDSAQLMTHSCFTRIDSNQLTTQNEFRKFDSNRLTTQKASRKL